MSGSPDPGTSASRQGSASSRPWVWLLGLLVVALLIFGVTRLVGGSDEPEAAGSGSAASSAPQEVSQQDEQDEQDEQGPVQVTRDTDGLAVKATVPDESTKTSLLQVIEARANGAEVVDKVRVSDGKRVADFAGLLPLLAAAEDVDELSVRVENDKVSVEGSAPSQATKEALSAAAKRAFPDREVSMQITAPTQAPTSIGSTEEAPAPLPQGSAS